MSSLGSGNWSQFASGWLENRGLDRQGLSFQQGQEYEGYLWAKALRPTVLTLFLMREHEVLGHQVLAVADTWRLGFRVPRVLSLAPRQQLNFSMHANGSTACGVVSGSCVLAKDARLGRLGRPRARSCRDATAATASSASPWRVGRLLLSKRRRQAACFWMMSSCNQGRGASTRACRWGRSVHCQALN